MKFISLSTCFCIYLLVNLFSCKKESIDIPIGTIKVKIDGLEKTFNVEAKAIRLNVSGGYGVQVQGYFRSNSTTTLRFRIVSPDPITTSTYIENAASNLLVTMTHCIEVIFPCVYQWSSYGSVTNPVSITITAITGTSIKGTFKGELQGSASGKTVFTNGVFYVSF